MDAIATYTVHQTTVHGRPCLKGIVDIESRKGWLGFATLFGFTLEEIQTAAYMEASSRAERHGLVLEYLQPGEPVFEWTAQGWSRIAPSRGQHSPCANASRHHGAELTNPSVEQRGW